MPTLTHPKNNEQPLPSLFAGSLRELRRPPKGQIPFLDGLRSLAILLVVSGHVSEKFSEVNGSTFYSRLPFVANGWIGVDLFFVLSGFFIGGQLWKELRRTGSIRFRDFVVRRGLRIWPLYYFIYLCVLTYASTLGHGASGKQYGWSDLIFITNYHNRGLVMGSWSLCTEEQFYILTPLLLIILASRLKPIERCRRWLWIMFFAVPVLRGAIWVHITGHFFGHDPALFSRLYYPSVTHCDGLLMGLILANLWETRTTFSTRLLRPWSIVGIAFLVLLLCHAVQKEVLDFTALAVFFGAFVWLGIQQSLHVFDSRIFFWLSRLSFGMYLNHEYMVPWFARHISPELFLPRMPVASNIIGVAGLILVSAALSLLTFCWIEHPFLQLRKRVLGGAPHTMPARDFKAVNR